MAISKFLIPKSGNLLMQPTRIALNKLVFDRVFHELGRVGKLKFTHNMAFVRLYRFRADE